MVCYATAHGSRRRPQDLPGSDTRGAGAERGRAAALHAVPVVSLPRQLGVGAAAALGLQEETRYRAQPVLPACRDPALPGLPRRRGRGHRGRHHRSRVQQVPRGTHRLLRLLRGRGPDGGGARPAGRRRPVAEGARHDLPARAGQPLHRGVARHPARCLRSPARHPHGLQSLLLPASAAGRRAGQGQGPGGALHGLARDAGAAARGAAGGVGAPPPQRHHSQREPAPTRPRNGAGQADLQRRLDQELGIRAVERRRDRLQRGRPEDGDRPRPGAAGVRGR